MKSIILAVMALSCAMAVHAKYYGDFIGAVFVRNYDGDTITFNLFGYPAIIGYEVSIRVRGIDTPEIRGKCEQEKTLAKIAKDLVNHLLSKAKKIELRNMGRGKYFRIVADVYVDGINIKDLLFEADLAVAYNGGTKTHDWCGNQ